RFQLAELQEANLTEGEDLALEEERNQLQNYEKLYRSVQVAYTALSGDGHGIESVNIARTSLQESESYAPEIKKYAEELTSIFYSIEEIGFSLRDFLDTLHYDEARLNEIEARLDELNRLKKKYGTTVT